MKTNINKARIARKYYPFLMLNVCKKKSVWAIFILYLLALALYLYIVPSIMHQSPFLIWSQTVMSIQSVLSYISAIFSSLLILAIYKNFRDDGTELLIVSKPISREKMLLVKAGVYLTFCILLSFVAMLLGLFIYCFDVPGSQQSGLVGSMFFTTLIFLVIFGAISLIVSIYLNKIWIILFSILLCAFSNIYYVIIKYANVVKTPTDGYLENGDTQIVTMNYLNSDGSSYSQYANIVSEKSAADAAAVISQSVLNPSISPLQPYLDCKQDYDNRVANSNYVIANYFNVTSQMNQMGNAFGLRQNVYDVSNKGFGWNRDVDYNITGSFLVDKFNSNVQTFPLMFIDYNKVPFMSETDASQQAKIMAYFMDQKNIASIFGEGVITIGNSTAQTSAFSGMSIFMEGNDNYSFVITYPDSRGKVGANPKDFKISKQEEDFFNVLLDSDSKIYFKKYGSSSYEYSLPKGLIASEISSNTKPFINISSDNKTFINSSNSIIYSDPAFTLVKANASVQDAPAFTSINEYVHFCLLNQISTDNSSWIKLDITSNEQLMKETLKFKYFILANKYFQQQEKYLNPILTAYADSPNTFLNDKHFGPIVAPFDMQKNGDSLAFGANPMFFDPEYIATSTLVKNFSLLQDKNGFAGKKTYTVDGKEYLDPFDFALRKGGNTGNISTNQDTLLTANFMGFTFESVDQITTAGLYLFWSFFAIVSYAIAYVIYSRIDFK